MLTFVWSLDTFLEFQVSHFSSLSNRANKSSQIQLNFREYFSTHYLA